MSNRAALVASCCLLLGGCARDLAGMPRIISGGTVVTGNETAETVQRNVVTRGQFDDLLQALTTRQTRILATRSSLDAQRDALRSLELEEERLQQQVRQLQQLQQAPQPEQQQQSQQQQHQRQQRMQERRAAEDRSSALQTRMARLREDIDGHERSLTEQQIDIARLQNVLEAAQNRPLPDAPAQVETFRQRFVRHVLDAQVNQPPPGAVDRMLASGYLLVRSSCDDFFSNTGVLQRDADIARDMIAPVLTILHGIVALRSLDQRSIDRRSQIFNLATGAGLAGISIVDKHFLFGAENVHQVRDLTFDALDAQEELIEGLGVLDFTRAAEQLIEFQVICTPASILRLTRDAIGAGRVVADISAGPSHDELVLEALARQLGRSGTLNAPQALALWKLYRNSAPEDNLPGPLFDELKALGLDGLVLAADAAATPPLNLRLSPSGSANRAEIYRLLGTFSPAARARLAEAAVGNPGQAEAADGGAAFALPPSRGSRRRARLVVQ